MDLLRDIYFTFYRENRGLYRVLGLTLISTPLRQISIPHFYGKIIDSLKTPDINRAKHFFFILLVIWVLIQGMNIVQSWAELHIWPKFTAYTEERLLYEIMDRYNTHFQELKTGEIITKLIKLPWILDSIQDYVQEFLMNNLLIIISNVGYLFWHSKWLGGIYLIGMIVFIALGVKFVKTCGRHKAKAEQHYDEAHGLIEDILSNLISVFTSKETEREKKIVRSNNQKTVHYQIKRQKCNLRFKIMFSIINILIFIGLNYTTIKLFSLKKLDLSALTAVFILNFNILNSLLMYYRNAKNFASVRADFKYINNFLNSLPEYSENGKKIINNPKEGISIELIDIDFTIPGTDNKIYDRLSLNIPTDQSLVIMGSIGSGKSTFARLLVGLQEYDRGSILLNGVDFKRLNIDNIRENIIYIPQSPVLFDRTLWENISYGHNGIKKNQTTSKIYKLLDDIGLTEVREIFEERMDLPVGKKGSNLSGGQRQIVWILRALLGKSKVVILDEPTSALDPKSKRLIKKLIMLLTKNRTLIVITHDLNLTEGMDRLIVFDEGKIISDKKLNSNSN